MADERELIAERERKVAELRALGANPYANDFAPAHTTAQVHAWFEQHPTGEGEGARFSVAGRIVAYRSFGKATFVELQTARSDAKHTYSYSFVSSPLPVTNYTSTIEVVAKNAGFSTVTWCSTYTPDAGKEKDADEVLRGVYEAGLNAIQTKLAK